MPAIIIDQLQENSENWISHSDSAVGRAGMQIRARALDAWLQWGARAEVLLKKIDSVATELTESDQQRRITNVRERIAAWLSRPAHKSPEYWDELEHEMSQNRLAFRDSEAGD